MLPRIDGHRKSSVVVGGAITAPAPGSRVGTASGPPPTRDQIVKTVSQRLVEESRVKSESHHRELASVAEELSQHPRLVAEARSLRQQARRQKKLEATRRCKPSNPLLAHPQPAFVDAGNNDEIFGLPLLPAKRSQWVSAARPDEDDDGPITHLKRALAQNFKRVVTLFKKWDVNCDGQVSTSELYDAIGALNLGNGVGQPEWSREACRALFTALDTNQSGAIDFGELHRALRKFDPPPLEEVIDITSPRSPQRTAESDSTHTRGLPARRKPRAVNHEAVGAIKRLLAVHQSRVMDLFRRWDYDMDASISEHELRRALAALSVPIEPRALKKLFAEIDLDGSGSISFDELNAVLRRHVSRDTGGGERYDADTGTYTTAHRSVKQHVKSTSLPAITMTASVTHMGAPQLISMAVPSEAARADKFLSGADKRDASALRSKEARDRQARETREDHYVE